VSGGTNGRRGASVRIWRGIGEAHSAACFAAAAAEPLGLVRKMTRRTAVDASEALGGTRGAPGRSGAPRVFWRRGKGHFYPEPRRHMHVAGEWHLGGSP
jgi:hypothetical protein